ncbi:glycosyl hydrolase family 61-domain-containing protein [Sordaria brevicollis]|uniref:lytic cellulose monooxygenase (C4-dehydrogenating) n=1 Tax=Sordaria brevicollis TaxID=83679 RepID=A0AAE0UCL1_SORBR|nr:glycosyl hydrolase family 61-domain-containing protein [Sordaria brevicollis]
MRTSTVLAGLAAVVAPLASAHTVLTTVFVNDKNQGDGTGIRMPVDGSTSTAPIINMYSNDMICGRDGLKKVSYTIPATAGSKMTFEFRAYADGNKPGFIDDSHQGPISVYAKAVSDFDQNPGGHGWFKIWHEGYDESTNKWAVQKVIETNGLLSISLPTGMPTGSYLLRTEVIAMQNVTTKPDGNWVTEPQFYANCVQVYLQGSSTGSLSIPKDKEVSIPGHVHPSDKGLNFNMYEMKGALPYIIPGPGLFRPTISGNVNSKAALTTPKNFPGAVPDNCILKNANWCGFEVPSYTNEDGCWAAADDCWRQSETCFHTAPPSGYQGCKVWEQEKCKVIQDHCQAKDFNGPPNKGKVWGDVSVKTAVKIPGVMKGADLVESEVPDVVAPVDTSKDEENKQEPNINVPAPELIESKPTTFITTAAPSATKAVTTVPAAAATTTAAPAAGGAGNEEESDNESDDEDYKPTTTVFNSEAAAAPTQTAASTTFIRCSRGDSKKKQKRRMHINRHKRGDF